jgi:amino acid adenylation domain-containing protein
MFPVETGEPGEIYVGGAGVAIGYLNRPELTGERFVPDPFSAGGKRLYRSGDLARRLPDGGLEFLGRVDDQVKIRGYRVELGEISSQLAAHPCIRQVVVLAVDEVSGKRLVAYVVPQPGKTASGNVLKEFLKTRLPEYMIPYTFVMMDELPLTPNGKVDRKALPAPSVERPTEEEFRVPTGTLEQRLCSIWEDILNIKRIGARDNFFILGGHSLLACQVISRVRHEFEVELPATAVFRSPTITELAEEIRKAQADGARLAFPPISRVSRRQPLPTTFGQEQVWFILEIAPGNLAYNAQETVRLAGPLDIEILEGTLTEIVRRHEIYRTTFILVDGKLSQVIHPPWKVSLPVIDLCDLPLAEREQFAEQLIQETIQQSFDISQLPLIRWVVFRLSDQDHIFLHVEHHFVHDGWSFSVFLSELKAIYLAMFNGDPSPLPELPIQFADFASWQRQLVDESWLQVQLDYWRSQLRDSPALLQLPSDRPRPRVKSFRGGWHRSLLDDGLYARLKELSLDQGVTLFMALLAVFKVLLYRYSGQVDFLVGAGLANRRLRETEYLIGMIVNEVVLRADLSGDPTFSELLARVKEVTLGAYANQDYPFARLVEALHPNRDLSYNPLFQVVFSFHDAPVPEIRMAGLTGEIDYIANDSAKFDLNVIIIPRAEQLAGQEAIELPKETTIIWEYDADLFDLATIERMAGHYQVLLNAFAHDPHLHISTAPILTEPEQHQIMVAWNDMRIAYPRQSCIHQLFEEQVARTPHSVALTFSGRQMEYHELNERANQLAHYLRSLGIGPDVPVGICLPRSMEMVVGMLAILKAGGAYVALDPAYPRQRLSWMLQDTQSPLILTAKELSPIFVDFEGQVICLDTDWPLIAQQDVGNPLNQTSPDNLAYLIYTSGSSGKPKGVLIPHRGVVRLVCEAQYAHLGPGEVFLQFAPVSFDASTFEIWGCLLNGSRLAIFPAEAPSLEELGRVIRDERVTTLWLTAGLFNQVIDWFPQALKGLSQLLVGGEALSILHVEKALAELEGCSLINGYGPTESTTFTCCYPVPPKGKLLSSVPIGKPITGTRVYILDQRMNPVPVGVPGELFIGGDGLARGYLNLPDLTREMFVSDPFSENLQDRLYKTGDLVRYLPDGNIEFLGRMDDQVKVRGFRVEPGEIETVMLGHPSVKQVAVLLRGDPSHDRQLVAYVVIQDAAKCETAELVAYIRQRIPEYMIPSTFMFLDHLPLTPNGKVDRKALLAKELLQSTEEGDPVGPRSPIEEKLAAIWHEVLGISQLSIHDNFFDLGGHSLKAMLAIFRTRAVFQVELPVSDLFQWPTIASLARRIEALQMIELKSDDSGDPMDHWEEGTV